MWNQGLQVKTNLKGKGYRVPASSSTDHSIVEAYAVSSFGCFDFLQDRLNFLFVLDGGIFVQRVAENAFRPRLVAQLQVDTRDLGVTGSDVRETVQIGDIKADGPVGLVLFKPQLREAAAGGLVMKILVQDLRGGIQSRVEVPVCLVGADQGVERFRVPGGQIVGLLQAGDGFAVFLLIQKRDSLFFEDQAVFGNVPPGFLVMEDRVIQPVEGHQNMRHAFVESGIARRGL